MLLLICKKVREALKGNSLSVKRIAMLRTAEYDEKVLFAMGENRNGKAFTLIYAAHLNSIS
jgi:hypothetical protein